MNAPVAIFVYNRADNTCQTINALKANKLASDTDVYVFSDGGKDEMSWKKVNEVRSLLHNIKKENDEKNFFKSFNIIERKENIYLERNIIEGIGYVLEDHDNIIVLEDDIVTSPFFLSYMNQAFNLYKDDEKVMHVSAFTHLDLPTPEFPETYFTPHMSGWGWGTWRNRWHKHFVHYQTEDEALQGMSEDDKNAIQYDGAFTCLKSLKKNPIPWDICWEIAIYKAGGLCLTPHHTLVRNIGLDNGTHFKSYSWIQRYEYDRKPLQQAIKLTHANPEKDQRIENRFKEAISDWGIRYTWIGKIIRYVYNIFKKNH